MSLPLVTVVIPCYNPDHFLEEALESARAQTYPLVEIILVNDGSDRPESLDLLRTLAPRATRLIEQENRGLAAARNAGFRAAAGICVVPLDADDRLSPTFIAECVGTLESDLDAAFVYTDYRVFGDKRYTERTGEYNLYDLLQQNTLIYASLIRRADWELAGGYDETMRLGYEDWDFWLRLGERERFGRHLPRVLFEYRKHGRTMLTVAREHHDEIVAQIHESHPNLFSRAGRARIKRRWSPSVCVLGRELQTQPTIEDWHSVPTGDRRQSNAPAFLFPGPGPDDPHSPELCALAIWGGHAALQLPDGSQALSRSHRRTVALSPIRPVEGLHRHLVNAELDLRHPLRSATRLIPLHVKERINRAAGRPVFDLSFYLRFQPQSVLTPDSLVEPLRYFPRRAEGRCRIALLTPHLGPGGAESVLLEVARAIDRHRAEVFVIATQSRDSGWRTRWEQVADHIYDLAPLIPPERMIAGIYSMATNWEFDTVVLQNSLAAYSALPFVRKDLPRVKIIDLIHAVDESWDFVSSTAPVASCIDIRVAISAAGVERLRKAGTPNENIRLIRNGVDFERFRPAPWDSSVILFAGRLDPVKRPLLLVEIASELRKLRPQADFQFFVAGDGPERTILETRVRRAGLDAFFKLLGSVDDMPSVLARSGMVVIPSRAEGIPLIALEAFATARPVVCSRVGAAEEVVDSEAGMLIEPGPVEAARFASALNALLSDPDLRRRMGEAGRRRVEADYNREESQRAYRSLVSSSGSMTNHSAPLTA